MIARVRRPVAPVGERGQGLTLVTLDCRPFDIARSVSEVDAAVYSPAVLRLRDQSWARGKVKITDEELVRMRKQVKRIAGKLEASADAGEDERFAVDSVALHVGVTASGQFVLGECGRRGGRRCHVETSNRDLDSLAS